MFEERNKAKRTKKPHCSGVKNCKGPKILPYHSIMNAAEAKAPESQIKDFITHGTGSSMIATYLHQVPLPTSLTGRCVQMDTYTCSELHNGK